MSRRYHRIVASLFVALGYQAAWAQDGASSQVLIDQGQYWQARDDAKRAAEAWNKLLLISPNNPHALYGLAMLDLKEKRIDNAQALYAKLKVAHPESPLLVSLDQEIALNSGNNMAVLEQARLLAASGELDEALVKYREALGGRQPHGTVGREYYTYLGYTSGGIDEAIAGLQRLARQAPDDPQIALSLARHLARNETTRLDGIKRLATLSDRSDIGSDAAESWRDALTWLGPPRSEARPLFDAYLQKNPDDTEIRQQLEKTKEVARSQPMAAAQPARIDPLRTQTDAAMKLLEQGDLVEAEARFQAVLAQRGNDNQALGGLGIIQMRQGNWVQARELLTRARRGNASWVQALRTVEYWEAVNQAETSYASGDLAGTRKILASVSKLAPKEIAADVLIADVLTKEGNLVQAEVAYRAALRKKPGDAGALSGLINALVQNNKLNEARQLIDSMPPGRVEQAGGIARLRAIYAQGLAKAARATGDDATARVALEDALRNDPTNVWIRVELAQLYQEAGRTSEAEGLVDGLLLSEPHNLDALYAGAMFASQNQEWAKAESLLARIPSQSQTSAMRTLQNTVSRQLELKRAVQLASQGNKPDALALLAQLEAGAKQDTGLLGSLAQAYTEIGEPAYGLALLRPVAASEGHESIDASLTYAGLLLRTNQDVEAATLIRHLQQQKLTPSQRRSLSELADLYTVRQADLLRERGDLVAAYDTLEPVLAKKPNDVLAVGALARMYTASGDGKKALELYEKTLHQDPDNPDLYLGVAQAAQQMKNHRYAAQQAEAAVSLAPERADILAGAARVYRAQGKTQQAAELFERAIALEGATASAAMSTLAQAPATASSNPFAGIPGQRAATSAEFTPTSGVPVAPPAMSARVTPPAGPSTPTSIPASDLVSRSSQLSTDGNAGRTSAPTEVFAPSEMVPSSGQSNEVVTNAPMKSHPPLPSMESVQTYIPYAPPTVAASDRATLTVAQNAGNPDYANSTSTLASELDGIYQERSAEIRVGTEFRSRTGDHGTSRLNEAQMPIEVRFPVGNDKMNVRVTPIVLSAGSLGSGLYERATFGDMINIGREQLYQVPNIKRPKGVGLSLGYETTGFTADLGVTPLGFQETNFTGGLLFDGMLDDAGSVSYRFDVSRRPVTDSVLSFAGMTDERTGAKWGGVSASGGRLTLVKDFGDAGVYGTAAWHYLDGRNVASNHRTELNTGTYFHFINEPNMRLTGGVNLNAAFFNRNQSFFSYGHGGYFSPKNYFSLGVPFTWAQREGKFTYRLDGAVGIQRFQTSDAPIYPTNSAMQARASRALQVVGAPELGDLSGGHYQGRSKTGVGYNLNAAAEYRFTPKLVLGASVGADNASDYRQWNAGLYFRYYFYPQSGLMDLPVEPYRSPYGITYGR